MFSPSRWNSCLIPNHPPSPNIFSGFQKVLPYNTAHCYEPGHPQIISITTLSQTTSHLTDAVSELEIHITYQLSRDRNREQKTNCFSINLHVQRPTTRLSKSSSQPMKILHLRKEAAAILLTIASHFRQQNT